MPPICVQIAVPLQLIAASSTSLSSEPLSCSFLFTSFILGIFGAIATIRQYNSHLIRCADSTNKVFQNKKKTYSQTSCRFMVDDTRLELVKACRCAPGLRRLIRLSKLKLE